MLRLSPALTMIFVELGACWARALLLADTPGIQLMGIKGAVGSSPAGSSSKYCFQAVEQVGMSIPRFRSFRDLQGQHWAFTRSRFSQVSKAMSLSPQARVQAAQDYPSPLKVCYLEELP